MFTSNTSWDFIQLSAALAASSLELMFTSNMSWDFIQLECTLGRAGKIGLPITPEIEAIAYELESVRDVITASTLQHERPHQNSTGANKHFFALEYLESQFMIAFLSEIKKRTRCVSIIWLHDGLWVPKELSNSLLLGCEQIAARQTFPTLPTWSSLFRVQDIFLPWSSLTGVIPLDRLIILGIFCCLAVTPAGFINCIIHASAALRTAFLREESCLWNRTLKLEPLTTAVTQSTWIAEKGTAKSCCHSYATPTLQMTKGTGF